MTIINVGLVARMKRKEKKLTGFTIIELSLSIAFIAILSLTVILIITNTISSYRRGIMLNQVNTTGMDLVDDLRLAVQNSPTEFVENACEKAYTSKDVVNDCINKNAKYFVTLTRTANLRLRSNNSLIGSNLPVYGAFCTGSYSYIWNSGYLMDSISANYNTNGVTAVGLKYRDENGNQQMTGFRLLKVHDTGRSICIAATKVAGNSSIHYSVDNSRIGMGGFFDITSTDYGIVDEEPVELLSNSANGNMVLYDLFASTASNTSNDAMFYSVSFVLGTLQGGINIKKASNNCATPTDYAVENFDYCSINKFNFAAQANGA